MIEGKDNYEIAASAFLAEQTARNYVHKVY